MTAPSLLSISCRAFLPPFLAFFVSVGCSGSSSPDGGGPGGNTGGNTGTGSGGFGSGGLDSENGAASGSGGAVGNTGGSGSVGFTDRTSQELVASLSLGWNLGNSLDAPEGETAWSNPTVSPQLLQAVADAGFDVVRIPVTWSLHTSAGPDYVIDAAWMTRVQQVVDYALDAGLYTIINLHHDGADGYAGVQWIDLRDPLSDVEDRFTKMWQQIATHFADYDERLIFESMNEIHENYANATPAHHSFINSLNQTFVDVIRASGPGNAQRHLLIPSYNTNIQFTLEGFVRPTDPTLNRLILSVHFYDPWPFAGEAATNIWGAANIGNDGWGQEEFVLDRFDLLKSTYVDTGLPVIIGEYGAVNQTGFEDYRRYYMEYVTKTAHDRGLLPVYWDNGSKESGGEAFGLLDRTDNSVLRPAILEAMVRAVSSDYEITAIAPANP